MSEERKRVAFSLTTEPRTADARALSLLNGLSKADRGRIMRQAMLAGLAMYQQNKNAPAVVGESLSEGQTLDQLRSLLLSAMPELLDGAPASPPAQPTQEAPPVKSAAENALLQNFFGEKNQ